MLRGVVFVLLTQHQHDVTVLPVASFAASIVATATAATDAVGVVAVGQQQLGVRNVGGVVLQSSLGGSQPILEHSCTGGTRDRALAGHAGVILRVVDQRNVGDSCQRVRISCVAAGMLSYSVFAQQVPTCVPAHPCLMLTLTPHLILSSHFPHLLAHTSYTQTHQGVYRGLGDTRKPLYATLAANALNVVLGYGLIFSAGLGVRWVRRRGWVLHCVMRCL